MSKLCRRAPRLSWIVAVACAGLIPQVLAQGGGEARLDPALRLIYRAVQARGDRPVAGQAAGQSVRTVRSPQELAERLSGRARGPAADAGVASSEARALNLLVKHAGDPAALAAAGFETDSRLGPIVSGRLLPERLPELVNAPGVLSVQLSHELRAFQVQPPRPLGSLRAAVLRASGAGVGPGLDGPVVAADASGTGALVAFIDTGVDIFHSDFRKADNTTRIKYLLDFSDPGDVDGDGDLDGTGPFGGTLYGEADINLALLGSGTVNQKDTTGHGTHGLSIAAGDDGTTPGFATAADLIVVKATRVDGTLSFTSGDILSALSFVDQKATELGAPGPAKPYVVNLSLGTLFSSHDGRSLEEQAIDALVGPGKPGKAVVIAAGNSSENRSARYHHFRDTTYVGLERSHQLTVPVYTATPGRGNDRLLLDIWYDGRDRHTIVVRPPAGCPEVTAVYGDFADVTTSCGDVFVANLGGASPSNGDTEAIVLIDDWSGSVPKDGVWTIAVRGEQAGGSGEYHGWLADESEIGGLEPYLSSNADNLFLVAKPGGAYNGITVGSFARHAEGTRFLTSWTDVGENARVDATAVNEDISDFSAPGRTRDGRIKPDLTAPGERVLGAVSRDAYPGVAANSAYRFHNFYPFAAALITQNAAPESTFGVLQGTSFAAPVVTGLVARMLSTNPALDAIQVRNILINTAAADAFTGVVPNPTWGYGKVDTAVGTVTPLPANLRINDDVLPSGVRDKQYNHVLTASGGNLPYTWALQVGSSLPPGLTLTAGGFLTGRPTSAGSFSFTIQVTDTTTPTPQTAARAFTVQVSAVPALNVLTSVLPAARIDIPYEEVLQAEGGAPGPYSWAVVGGDLPPGLTLLGNGVLQGVPDGLGRFDFTVEVQDSALASARRSLKVKVVGPGGEDWDPLGKTTPTVNQIAVDRNDPTRVFVSTRNIDAVFETRSSGDTWRATSINNNLNDAAYQLRISPLSSTPWLIQQRGVQSSEGNSVFMFDRVLDRWLARLSFGGYDYGEAIAFDAADNVFVSGTRRPFYRSNDQGMSWAGIGTLCGGDGGSGSLSVFKPDPTYMFMARTNGVTCATEDGGATWPDLSFFSGGGVDVRVSQTDRFDVVKANGSTAWKSVDGGRNWTGFNLGGSINALDRSETEPSVILAGATDGLYKSSDGGQTYFRLPIKGANPSVTSVAIDPSNPDGLYVGTVTGVFRSSDGGLTWTLKNSGLVRRTLSRVVLSAANPNDVMIAASEGPYTSRTGGATWTLSREGLGSAPLGQMAISPASADLFYVSASDNLYRSDNRGVTWSTPHPTFFSGVAIVALDADPFDADTVVASQGGARGTYRSQDRGLTWVAAGNVQLPLVEPTDLSFARDVPGRLYLSLLTKGIYLSPDKGSTWAPFGLNTLTVNEVEPAPSDSEYVYARTGSTIYFRAGAGASFTPATTNPSRPLNDIAVDAIDPLVAYGGADHSGVAGAAGGIYKTTDGGRNWARVPGVLDGFDVVALAAHPATSGILYAATLNAGVYRSDDGGVTWTELGNYGTVADLTNVTVQDPTNANLIFAGTEGYGVQVSTDKGRTFVPRVNGLGNLYVNALAFDPDSPQTLYAGTDAGIYKTTNSGTAWAATDQTTGEVTDIVTKSGGLGDDIWATVVGQGVAHSSDGGATFDTFTSGLSSLELTSVEVKHKTSGDDIWATMRGGSGVAVSHDGGQTWLSASGNGLTDRNVNDLVIGVGHDIWATGDDIWATADSGVFFTTDEGLTWTKLSLGLPSGVPVTSAAVDQNTGEVLVSLFSEGEGGVYRGGNINGVWSAFNSGLGELKVRKLTRDNGRSLDASTSATTFFASTAGDGVYVAEVTSRNDNPVRITTETLPDAVLRQGYSTALNAQGGKPPHAWALTEGALPAGLRLDAATGVISGQASEVGVFSFTLQASDAFSRTDQRRLAIRVLGANHLSIDDVTIAEGDSATAAATFTVSLSTAHIEEVTVEYATATGTAAAGSDYLAASGTLTFLPGVVERTLTVLVNGDVTAEPDETFFVQLRNAVGATLARSQGTATILDEEQTLPALSIADSVVSEGNSGTTAAVFPVRLSTASTRSISVAYVTNAGSATEGSDYVLTSGTLSFGPGVTEQTIQVPVIGDTLEEEAETFLVTLSSPVNAAFGRAQATGTILSEELLPKISIDDPVNDFQVNEGDSGVTNAPFEVVLSRSSTQQITVAYTTVDGSATAGSDYTLTSGTLTFAPGVTSQTIFVPIVGDTVAEAQFETFVLGISNPTNAALATPQATLTIVDEEPLPTLSILDTQAAEGDSGTTNASVSVQRGGSTAQEVTVAYTTTAGSATEGEDYQLTAGTLTFAPAETSKTILVPVVGDTQQEPDETFTVTLSSPTNALLSKAQAVVTIVNETLPTVGIASNSVSEGDSGTASLVFNVTLSKSSGNQITVGYATSNGTAEADTDYLATSGTLTFVSGVTAQTISVTINGDTVPEAHETFFVTLSSPSNATLGQAQATGTIQDEEVLPTLSISSDSPRENDDFATLQVSLSPASAQEVTVAYATSNGTATAGADYQSTTGTLTFAPGVMQGAIVVPIVDDGVPEASEDFFVTLSNAVNAAIYDGGSRATVEIQDPNPAPTLSIADGHARELESGLSQAAFVVTLSPASALPVTAAYTTSNRTATAGSDYQSTSGSLTFSPSVTTQTILVPIIGDSAQETSENFLVTLSNPTNALLERAQAVGTIMEPLVAVSVGDVTVTEADVGATTATFEVRLSRPVGSVVAVDYSTVDGTARAGTDYEARQGTLHFLPGVTALSVEVPVLSNTHDDPERSFTLALSQRQLQCCGLVFAGTGSVIQGARVDAAGVPALVVSVTAPADVNGLAVDQQGRWLYAAHSSGQVSAFSIQEGGPPSFAVQLAAVPGSPFVSTSGSRSIAVDPAGRWVYVAGNQLSVFSVNPVTGTLTPVPGSPFALPSASGLGLGSRTIAATARPFVYVGLTNGIAGFQVEPTSGSLGPLPVTSLGEGLGVSDLLAPRSERFVYASLTGGNFLDKYEVDWATGGLVRLERRATASRSLAVDREGRFLFVELGGGVTRYDEVDPSFNPPVTLAAPSDSLLTFVPFAEGVRGYLYTTRNSVGARPAFRLEMSGAFLDGSNVLQPAVTATAVAEVPEPLSFTKPLGVARVIDNDRIALSIADVTVTEGSPNAVLIVSLASSPSDEVRVDYQTADLTATSPGDYQTTSGTLVFAPNERVRTVVVPITMPDDSTDQLAKSFVVNLSNATNATIADGQAVATLVDDDQRVISINSPTVAEGNAGTTNAVFTVSLNALSVRTVTVDFTTVLGSATPGVDYQTTAETVTFAPGSVTQTISVPVFGNLVDDSNRTFSIALTNPTNALIANRQGPLDITWRQLGPTPPFSRFDTGLAYDGATDRLIVFGGGPYTCCSSASNEVWVLENALANDSTSRWRQLLPSGTAPSGRQTHAVVYDRGSNRLIVHGGGQYEGDPGSGRDTWVLTGANGIGAAQWIRLPDYPGNPHHRIATAYDGVSNRMIVFGGNVVEVGLVNEVWVLKDANGLGTPEWIQLNPAGAAPSARRGAVAYDSGSNRLILFGGDFNNDVWVLTGANGTGGIPAWIRLTPEGAPPIPRHHHSLAYDAQTNTLYVFGGYKGYFGTLIGHVALGDTWLLTNANGVGGSPRWSEVSAAGPSARWRNGYAGGAEAALIVFQSGNASGDSGLTADFWVLKDTPPGTATILDDDAAPAVSVGDASAVEGNSGLTNATFTLSLSGASARQIDVSHSTADGSARAGPDYAATSGGVTIPPGVTTATFSISVKGDVFLEGNETFFVNLTSASNAAIGDGQALGTILNDDAPSPDAPVPDIDALDPVAAAPGGPGFQLRVVGANFQPLSQIRWNGSDRPTTFVSTRELRASIAAADIAAAGIARVSVFTPPLGGGSSESLPFVVSPTSASISFTRANLDTGTGSKPIFVAAADLNADGRPDLVTANAEGDSISVFLGNGDGTFAPRVDYPAGDYPRWVHVADLDKDGDADLAVAHYSSSSDVSVFLNNGPGTFAPRVGYSAGVGNLETVVAGDFNADGMPDLAAGGTGVSVLLRNSDGTYLSPGYVSSPGNSFLMLEAGDFNGDGRLDLLSSAYATGALLLAGNGEGVFTQSTAYSCCGYNQRMAAGDFNRDGALDFLFATLYPWGDGTGATVFFGNNAGVFSGGPGSPDLASTYFPAVADFNADGVLDSAWTNLNDASVALLLGSGLYGFAAPTDFATGTSPYGAAAADFNGDGRVDLATANYGSNTVSVFTNVPPPTLSIGDASVNEGNLGPADALFTVTLSAPSVARVNVDYATANGTAAAGSDYVAKSGTLVFSPGETTKTVTVTVFGDTTYEANETFFLNLSGPNGAVLAEDGQGQGTIVNDDPGLILSVSDVTVTEGDSGSPTATFSVSMPAAVPAGQTVTVNYTTADGTAAAGSDYQVTSGTLTFSENQFFKTVVVPVLPDLSDELDETFTMNLSSQVGAAIVDSQGVATIVDDDNATVSVGDVTVSEGDSGLTNAAFVLSLSAPSASQIIVAYSTADESARAGPDYAATSGSLTIPAGQISGTINVPVKGDVFFENDETFLLNLTSASNAAIGDGQGRGTITNDDVPSPDRPVPDLDALDPVSAVPSGAGFALRVFGANFQPASQVRWNGSDRTTTFVSARELSASIPASDVASASVARVTVFTPLPGGGSSPPLAFVVGPASAAVSFTRANLGTGSGSRPIFVAAADLNADGRPDLVTANAESDSISVFLGTGAGTFATRADYPAGDYPRWVHVADLDQDGDPDLAVANYNSSDVSVYLGNAGAFAPRFDLAAGVGNLVTVVAGDFNGDGRLDLAAGGTGGVSVLLRNSDGTYLSPGYVSSAGYFFLMLESGDFNGDGRLDLLGTANANSTFLLAGNGEGVFTQSTANGYCCYELRMAAGDFNRDGALDYLWVPHYNGSGVTLFSGNNAGVFSGVSGSPGLPSPYFPAVADFNADGVLDSAWTNVNHASVSLVLGSGYYGFSTPTDFAVGSSPYGAAAADFNGDGRMDLATANYGSDTVSILTNVPPPSLGIGDVSLSEGNLGGKDAVFTVTLSSSSIATVTVNYATADGTATAASDYVTKSGSLTFLPGETTKTVTVVIFGDTAYEPNENFFLNLSGSNGAALAEGQGQVTIVNDDSGMLLSVADLTVTEGDSGSPAVTFTVSMPAAVPAGQTVTVNYTTAGGTATAGSDYQTTSGALTFNEGQASLPVAVPLVPDLLDELDETFTMNLSTAAGAVIVDAQGVATILDDDAATVSVGDVSVAEGNSGLTNAVFTVSLSAISARQIDVAYSTADDTARSGPDYVATSGSVTIPAGQVSATLSVPVRGDPFLENAETFFVNLTPAAGLTIVDGQGRATIVNDDVASPDNPVPALHAVDPVSAAPGSAGFELRVIGSNFLPASVVQWNGVNRTTTYQSPRELRAAIPAADVAATSVARVTVFSASPGGGSSDPAAFVVSLPTMAVSFTRADVAAADGPRFVAAGDVNGDGRADLAVANSEDDTVSVFLGNGNGTFAPRFGYAAGDGPNWIALADLDRDGDLDMAVTNFNAGTVSIFLGNGPGGFAARSDYDSGAQPSSVVVADFNADGKLDLAVGRSSGQGVSVLLGNGDGTFLSPGYVSGTSGYGVSMLVAGEFNGDGRLDLLASYANGVQLLTGNSEGVFTMSQVAGSCCTDWRVALTDFNRDGALDFSWTNYYGDTNGLTAYFGNNAGGFGWNGYSAGMPSPYFPVVADFNSDGVLDSAWTNRNHASVSVVLGTSNYPYFAAPVEFATGTNPPGAAAADFNGDGRIDLAVANYASDTISILTNAPPPALTVSNASVAEGNALTADAFFTITLSPPSVATVTVNYATADGTATAASDYVYKTGTLTFLPSETTKSVAVTVFGDTAFEPDETFFLNLSGANGADVADSQGQGTIVNDDTGFALSVNDVTLVEGDSGSVSAVLTVSMPVAVPAGQSVTVNYTTAGASASDGIDFQTTSGTLTFNESESSKTVAVPLVPDTIDEADETFNLNLSSPTGGLIVDGVGVATITDDDPTPALSVSDVSVTEGNGPGTTDAVFTVSLSAPSGLTVIVSYSTANGGALSGADYNPVSGSLTFTPGMTARTVTVPVVRDGLQEPGETFFLNLTSPTNAGVLDGQGQATILDDDLREKAVLQSPAPGSTLAGTSITFSWTAGTNASEYWLDVGSTLGSGNFFSQSMGTSLSATVSGLPADGWTLYVRLHTKLDNVWQSNDYGYRAALPSLTIGDAALSEAPTSAAFRVSLSGPSPLAITVAYTTLNGSAVAGSDYSTASGTLTFQPGETSQSVLVPILNDIFIEAAETFSVSLSAPVNANIADGSGTGTILNDDAPLPLTVGRTGTGSGSVTSSPNGIDCGAACTASFDPGTVVTLTAAPDAKSDFTGWSGSCSGSGACQVTLDAAKFVTASFTKKSFALSVSKAGSGGGSVTSSPAGISCGSSCSAAFDVDTSVTLTASADAGSVFAGWGGACSGTGGCAVTMSEAKAVTATFTTSAYELAVSKIGSGGGTVTSSPGGINCGSSCSAAFDFNTVVTLTATANADSDFTGWSGACSGTGGCQVTMDAAKAVTATFTPKTFTLSVAKAGSGGGTVSSDPGGIACGSGCSAAFAFNTLVTLTAAANADSDFSGWGGACSGAASCQVRLDGAKSVTATFTKKRHSLSVTKAGTGAGTVSSTPAGISCGSACSASYDHGTSVTLTASPETDSDFGGWSGACSGAGSCQVTLDGAKSVTATFTKKRHSLSVTKAGAGAGTVSSTPAGISCGSACSASYDHGTSVTLTASPDTNSDFSGWSGACVGAGACSVTLDAAKQVEARFERAKTLTVCASGCRHTKIQDAINASIAGGVVLVKSSYDSAAAGELFPLQTQAVSGSITITGETDGAGKPATTVGIRSPADDFKSGLIIVSPGSVVSNLRFVSGDGAYVGRVIAAAAVGACPSACHLNGLTISNLVIDFASTWRTGNGLELAADNVVIRDVALSGIAGSSMSLDGNNYTIQNNTLDGRDAAAGAIRSLLAIGFGADKHSPSGAACAGAPTSYSITGNSILGYRDGIQWCTGRNNAISNNVITDVSGRAIDSSGSQGSQITGNTITQLTTGGTHGIGLSANASQACAGNRIALNRIIGRAARDLQRGIAVVECVDTEITSNEVRNFGDAGGSIFVSLSPGLATRTVIQGNTVAGGNASGIIYFGSDAGDTAGDGSVVRDNVVSDHQRNGIVVQQVKGVGNVVAYNVVRAANLGGHANTHGFNLQSLKGTAFDRNEALATGGAGVGFFLANSSNVSGTCNTGTANGGGLLSQASVTPPYQNVIVNCRVALYTKHDFEGDGKADVAVYRHTTGSWYIRRSSDGQDWQIDFGCPSCDDVPAPANYTLSGQTDVAVYRFPTGEWFIRRSTDGGTTVIPFGAPSLGDVPVPANYTQPDKADIAVYRTSTAEWYIRRSSDGATQYFAWGCAACADLPVPGDYDGDGLADIGVYRRSTGEWFIRRSSDGRLLYVEWGSAPLGDLPVPGNYTTSGKTDIAIYRSLSGGWFIRRATDGGLTQVDFGSPANGDFPVPANFTQAGLTDVAVFRPGTAEWFIRRSTDGDVTRVPYGMPHLLDAPLTSR